jgi:hypothetical protein
MMLLDLLAERATRRRALETALGAYVLLDLWLATRVERLELSADAIVLLSIILDEPETARAALVTSVRIALRFSNSVRGNASRAEHWEQFLRKGLTCPVDVLRLARDVARVTVLDLSSVGPFTLVVELLAAEESSRPRAHAA